MALKHNTVLRYNNLADFNSSFAKNMALLGFAEDLKIEAVITTAAESNGEAPLTVQITKILNSD